MKFVKEAKIDLPISSAPLSLFFNKEYLNVEREKSAFNVNVKNLIRLDIQASLIYKLIIFFLVKHSIGQNLLLPVKTPICALLQNLMECSQCELALRLIVCLFGSCLQHCVSNNMDMCLGEKVWTKPILNFTESKSTKYG